jgi:hypothetical protein
VRLCLSVCVCVARAGACAQVSTPAEPAQATLLGAATIQEDIKQAHGHGLRDFKGHKRSGAALLLLEILV